MKNTMKVALVVLTSLAMNSIAFAGALTLSGSANMRYQIMSSDSAAAGNELDKGIGLTNEFTIGASGELENGWSWNYAMDVDPGTAGAFAYDDAKLSFETGFGTIGMFISEGSLGTKYGWDTSAYGVGSDTGNGFGMTYGANISSYDNLQYHTPAGMLPLGATFAIAYSPTGQAQFSSGGTATANVGTIADATQYRIKLAPVDGLDIGADYMSQDASNDVEQEGEHGSYYAKYTAGPVSVGYGKSFNAIALTSLTDGYTAAKDTALADYESIENRSYGIGFTVNDNLSVSYTNEESNPDAMTAATATYTMEISSIQLAYTMGGMTISISQDSAENADYIQNADEKETLIAVGIGF
jgi:hypothetical protein